MPKKLSNLPARTDLTDRECAKIIGGVLYGLCQVSCPTTVRAAVQWWAETDKAWAPMENFDREERAHAAK